MLETESIFETMSAILASWKKHREATKDTKAVQSDQIAPEDVQGGAKRVRLIFHKIDNHCVLRSRMYSPLNLLSPPHLYVANLPPPRNLFYPMFPSAKFDEPYCRQAQASVQCETHGR